MNNNPTDPDPAARPLKTIDLPYQFGRPPGTYVSTQQVTRLTIFRSRLYEGLCSHASLARRSEGNMDVHQCATCRTALSS